MKKDRDTVKLLTLQKTTKKDKNTQNTQKHVKKEKIHNNTQKTTKKDNKNRKIKK